MYTTNYIYIVSYILINSGILCIHVEAHDVLFVVGDVMVSHL